MKHRIIATITTLLALTFSMPAWAAGSHYVGLGAGAINLGNGLNKKAVFGSYLQIGHHFSEYFGAEVRLGATASQTSNLPTPAKQRMDFVAHYLKPQYPFTTNLTGYALIGFAVVHTTYQPTGGTKQSKNRIGYAYGLGLDYQLNDDYSAGIEWSHMLSKPKNTAATISTNFKGLEASLFTAAVRYHF
ncbi:porin family protein [Mariprofundus ferrooxydans]|uniref:porin family protein n=1 Tax=Mariprofundus ferrooxydans TaxID=314344 RepID=UPI00036176FE|nr:porin family protein [Mariprofundus ferrooxydans]